jgi:hypothetical protein
MNPALSTTLIMLGCVAVPAALLVALTSVPLLGAVFSVLAIAFFAAFVGRGLVYLAKLILDK